MIFDEEFKQKLKAFYSLYEGERKPGNCGYRCSGRTSILAEIFLQTAIETGKKVTVHDHYVLTRKAMQTRDTMLIAVVKVIEMYRKAGLNISYKIDRRSGSFEAELRPNVGFMHEYTEALYNKIKISPFPIEKLLQRKEFLIKNLLLLS